MRHRTLLLIAAVTGLLACACGGTEAERLHRAAMREYLDPIRPGYEGRNPFWNAFATKFIYAPAFGFEPVENAVKYRFTVSHLGTSMVESPRYRKDAPTEDPEPRRVLGPGVPTGRSWSFEADSPQQSLAPVWNDIPAGRVRVTAEGLDASGRVLGKAGEREFLRDFPFRPPYNGNVRPYAEAARMAALYIHELPAIRRWLTAAEPDMTYRHNTYACKIVGATIQLEVLVAKLLPAHREEALAIARNAARFLMDRSRPEGDPLAFFPPTYYSDLISSSRAENRGKTMTMEACAAISDALGIRICKNLFLCNRQKTDFYLLTMPEDKPFHTKDLSAQIGSSRLSFAPPELMEELIHCTPGSASVLGLAYDTEHRIRLLMDRETYEAAQFGCHPCLNTGSLRMATADLLNVFLPHTGHTVTVVDLPNE